ncbi:ATP-binding protein [Microbacterium invictum]|uniref:ATP-binding protein n=1 Tax=Microbacterium invictum TaxID=515415 RepID=A0ABZ0VB42_9MICO|nr:ATP-binding protein [Microbacterium invictum]WQB70838.1 ATP-binding protein [Microbacterium invictum]
MPQSPLLVDFAVALPIAVGIAYLLARLILAIFGRRLSLSITAMTLISLLGFSVGIFLAGMFLYGQRLWMPTTLLLTFGSSLALSFLVASIVALTQRGAGEADVPAVLRAGESERVEFKETARWNVREDKKDARMELAIAKTIAAFLNSRGGVLVIGANDAGEAVGLHRDLATLRTPDHDRFELWLRDLLSTALGRNAAALPRIRFVGVPPEGTVVCAVECPPSPKPVFLAAPGGGASTELWIRVGNSTRALPVDEALAYVQRQWRPTLATVLTGRPAG